MAGGAPVGRVALTLRVEDAVVVTVEGGGQVVVRLTGVERGRAAVVVEAPRDWRVSRDPRGSDARKDDPG